MTLSLARIKALNGMSQVPSRFAEGVIEQVLAAKITNHIFLFD